MASLLSTFSFCSMLVIICVNECKFYMLIALRGYICAHLFMFRSHNYKKLHNHIWLHVTFNDVTKCVWSNGSDEFQIMHQNRLPWRQTAIRSIVY